MNDDMKTICAPTRYYYLLKHDYCCSGEREAATLSAVPSRSNDGNRLQQLVVRALAKLGPGMQNRDTLFSFYSIYPWDFTLYRED